MDEVVVEAAMPGAVVGDIPPENRLNPAQIAAYGDSTINDLLNDIAQQTQSDQGRGGTAPIILVNGKRVSGVNEVGDIHDAAGGIPQIYQPAFLDPYGRTVGLAFRKLL
jgi:iron complex outermembrane recepter protein